MEIITFRVNETDLKFLWLRRNGVSTVLIIPFTLVKNDECMICALWYILYNIQEFLKDLSQRELSLQQKSYIFCICFQQWMLLEFTNLTSCECLEKLLGCVLSHACLPFWGLALLWCFHLCKQLLVFLYKGHLRLNCSLLCILSSTF